MGGEGCFQYAHPTAGGMDKTSRAVMVLIHQGEWDGRARYSTSVQPEGESVAARHVQTPHFQVDWYGSFHVLRGNTGRFDFLSCIFITGSCRRSANLLTFSGWRFRVAVAHGEAGLGPPCPQENH